MRLAFAAMPLGALIVLLAAPALAAPQRLALTPADLDRDGAVSVEEAAAWLDRDRGAIVPVRLPAPARAAAATEQRRAMFEQGLLRPNDFRAPAPEDRPPEELFYKDFKKIKR
jgi:hypothetical protein